MSFKIWWKKLWGMELSPEEKLYDHKGPVLVAAPKPQGNQDAPSVVPALTPGMPTGIGEVLGVDVSHYQNRVDWKHLRDLGYRFAFAKATDGKQGIDAMFATHKSDAKAAGFIFGAYHFFRFGDDPAEQMVNFMKTAGTVEPGELPHTIDCEPDRFSAKYCEGKEMDAEAADLVFLAATVLGHSIKMLPMIYTGFYFFKPGTRGESFAQMPLWVPSYAPKDFAYVKIPAPWKTAKFWQFSESLSFGGVDKVDGNKFMGTMEELKAMVK